MAGHVFLTYSASDATDPYVQAVIGRLTAAGLSVHAQQDTNAHTVSAATRKLVDACGVLVPVIMAATEASARVRLEVEYAREQGKPVLALWVDGTVPGWLGQVELDHVAGRRPPSAPFVERLRDLAVAASGVPPPPPRAPVEPVGPRSAERPGPLYRHPWPDLLPPPYAGPPHPAPQPLPPHSGPPPPPHAAAPAHPPSGTQRRAPAGPPHPSRPHPPRRPLPAVGRAAERSPLRRPLVLLMILVGLLVLAAGSALVVYVLAGGHVP